MGVFTRALGISELIMLVLFVSCKSQSCFEIPQNSNECSFRHLSSNSTWCEAGSFTNTTFTMYIKPDQDFEELQIEMTKPVGSRWVIRDDDAYFRLGRDVIFITHKWYKVNIRDTNKGRFSRRNYSLYINGILKATKTLLFTQPSQFTVTIKGPLSFSAQCNPANIARSLQRVNPSKAPTTDKDLARNMWLDTIIAGVAGSIIAVIAIVLVVINRKWKRQDRLFEEYDDETTYENDQGRSLHI